MSRPGFSDKRGSAGLFVADKGGIKNMSLFSRRSAAECAFASSDAWVVLSPMERAIRRKVEAAGTPLRDWDVNIYRGVLTGYNDAFIVTTERRDAILAACRTGAERERTAALIRPILRGRDIRRYGYQWAGLWIINTHNGIKGQLERVHIEDYPAVKAHLDRYWDKISTRTDKGDTPYNLRNCAYMGDFARPKIVYQELARTGNAFAVDEEKMFVGNSAYMLTIDGDSLDELLYISAILNSRLTLYYLDKLTTRFDDNGWRWLRQFVDELVVPRFKERRRVCELARELSGNKTKENVERLNSAVFDIFGLTESERTFINDYLTGY